MKACITNWTKSTAQLVMIRARHVIEDMQYSYYIPELQIVMENENGTCDLSRGVIIQLDRKYDTVHELVMRTSMWADVMYDRVDAYVTVVAEDGTVIDTLDIAKEFGVELAENELRELKKEKHRLALH